MDGEPPPPNRRPGGEKVSGLGNVKKKRGGVVTTCAQTGLEMWVTTNLGGVVDKRGANDDFT